MIQLTKKLILIRRISQYLMLFLGFLSYSQIENTSLELDSIYKLRTLSYNFEIGQEDQFRYGQLAVDLSRKLDIDTTILESYQKLSYLYLYYDQDEKFGSINKEGLQLAEKIKDTLKIGFSFQNLGYYYETRNQHDSAYYYYFNAEKYLAQVGETKRRAESLSSMANIQEIERDYVGSESNAVKAITLYNSLPKTNSNIRKLCVLYNLLAICSHKMRNYDEAISYYQQAMNTSKNTDIHLFYSLNSKNNIGYVYFEKGEYDKALELYNEVFSDERLYELDYTLYVTVKENIAQVKYELGTFSIEEIEKEYLDSFQLSDSLNDLYGIVATGNDFADFYVREKQIEKASDIAKRSLDAAREINANEEILKSLKILSKTQPGEQGKMYLYEHIKLSDSLLQKERSIRNKFAKIEYETDQILAEKEQLSKERLVFLMSSIGLLVLLILIYVIITQRSKNKELRFAQQQQEANEEIYHLMLAQQEKVEEGRTQEKKRISQELHDGILGRLFGTRLSLDSLNLVKTDEAVKSRFGYIEELKNIEHEIRKISHDLNADFVSGSSFQDIISSLVETQTKAYNLKHTLEVGDKINWDEVPNRTKMHVYRMLQECMQNIYKHAEAKWLGISFSLENDVILMRVVDDGKGFNVNKSKRGIGIKNINSRVNEVDGNVEIASEIGKGTTIEIRVPV